MVLDCICDVIFDKLLSSIVVIVVVFQKKGKFCVEMWVVLVFGGVLWFDFLKLLVLEFMEIFLYSNICVMKIGLFIIVDKIVELIQCMFNLNIMDKIYFIFFFKKIIYKKMLDFQLNEEVLVWWCFIFVDDFV